MADNEIYFIEYCNIVFVNSNISDVVRDLIPSVFLLMENSMSDIIRNIKKREPSTPNIRKCIKQGRK